jgi:phosphoglycolate phosphatase
VEEFCRLSVGFELAVIPLGAEMYSDCADVLLALKAKGHRLGICSNETQDYIKAILKKFGLESIFDAVYSKRQGGSKNQGAKITVEAMGMQRPSIFVGDRKADVLAAKSNQMLSVGILHRFGSEEELKESDYVVKDLNEFYSVVEELCNGQN